ncbi:MAG TPA: hypothetical protein VJO99_02095 [Burkholderiaceae bacterium]|nr:hypothetical protein [Burkholderiaceae bacterium]
MGSSIVTVCPANGQPPGLHGGATRGGVKAPGFTTVTVELPNWRVSAPSACEACGAAQVAVEVHAALAKTTHKR